MDHSSPRKRPRVSPSGPARLADIMNVMEGNKSLYPPEGHNSNTTSRSDHSYPSRNSSRGYSRHTRPRIHTSSKEVDEITNFLQYILQYSTEMLYEVEARLGSLTLQENSTAGFKNGVVEDDFLYLLKELKGEQDKEMIYSQTDEFIYSHHRGNVRVSFSTEDRTLIQPTVVTRRCNKLNLECPRCNYDCRISISTEDELQPYEVLEWLEESSSLKRMRRRQRWSFYKQNNIWKILLTRVQTWQGTTEMRTAVEEAIKSTDTCLPEDEELVSEEPEDQTFDIELLLMPDVLADLLIKARDRENLEFIASKYWKQIQFYNNKLSNTRYRNSGRRGGRRGRSPYENRSRSGTRSLSPSPLPPEVNSQFPELKLKRLDAGSSDALDLQKHCLRCAPGCSSHSSFPGSMPVNFSRRHWAQLQTNRYFVSEKTDGVRYMLLITDHHPYLIDRKFDIYEVPEFSELCELFAQKEFSLFDGELVRHEDTNKLVFMLFDVLRVDGQSYGEKDLSARLVAIGQCVEEYRSAITDGKIRKDHPFTIIGKRFINAREIRKLFDKHIIKKDNKYFYKDHRRHHRTDGIIFTPDGPYVPHTAERMFKWKYPDLLSIDFTLAPRGDSGYSLKCNGGSGQGTIDCMVAVFSEEDQEKLRADQNKRQQHRTNVIVECMYDTCTGQWRYICLRPDKRKPNHISVVFDTLLTLAEGISKEELQYRCERSTEKDDWEYRVGGGSKGKKGVI